MIAPLHGPGSRRAPTLLLASLAPLCQLTALTAQHPVEGYSSAVRSLPANAGNVLHVGTGLVWFDGQDLLLQRGGATTVLLHLPAPAFGSFTIDAGAGHVLFGESSRDGIWRVALNGPPPAQPLATVPLNYDAVLLDAGRAIVSARTGGWSSADNDFLVLDLQTGATQVFLRIQGASGPVALGPDGHLHLASASPLYPPPPGTATILRYARSSIEQALLTNQVLGPNHGQMVAGGIDAASDLAFDAEGDLFFVDWWNNRVSVVPFATTSPRPAADLIVHGASTLGPTSLQMVRGSGPAVFEPFQPTGATLLVHETSYGAVSQVRSVRSRRPLADVAPPGPVPSGPFSIGLIHGPSNGLGLLALGLGSPATPRVLTVPGFASPLHWESGLLGPVHTSFVAFDAQGRASVPFTNPGASPAVACTGQFATIDAMGEHLGSSNPVHFDLGR